MRSLCWLCGLVVLLAIAAPAAHAAEVQRPEERAYVVLDGPRGWEVNFALYPRRNVAAVIAEKGHPWMKRSRWLGAAYAVHPQAGAFEGGVNVSFGKLGGLVGRFVASEPPKKGRRSRFCKGRRPVSESGHFIGRITFRGDGGYLGVRARHAREFVSRSFRLRCRHGHAQHFKNYIPGLFGYIAPGAGFFNDDGTFLESRLNSRHRYRDFIALHHLFERTSTFKASVLEWLPEEVATTRWVEVSRVAVDTFTTSEPKLHPASATIDPPFPFSGTGTYSRRGHGLRGDLSVAFPGLRLRLAGKEAKAVLCVFTRQMQERVCSGA